MGITIVVLGLFVSPARRRPPNFCLFGADEAFTSPICRSFHANSARPFSLSLFLSHTPARGDVFAVDALPFAHALINRCRSPSGGLRSQGVSRFFITD